MTTNIDNSQRTAAKVAGMERLLAFVIVVFGNYILLKPLVVPRNAADTAHNILAHQTQFRVAADLLHYLWPRRNRFAQRRFTSFSRRSIADSRSPARCSASSSRSCGSLRRSIFSAALRLLGNANYLQVFEPDRLQALARLQIGANFDDYYVGLPFFGLAATVCAWLWLKSNYIPSGLSIFGVIASAWCVLCAFVYLIFPDFNKIVNDYMFDTPMALFELVVSFWLLFKGLKPVASVSSQTGVV